MPQRPDGKPARAERVTFTKNASERIAKAVRKVESGNRDASGFGFGYREAGGGGAKVFRICTFTGEWSIDALKTVTFKFATNTPNTVSAVNLFFPSLPGLGTRDCAIAKDGSAWYLLQVQYNSSDFFSGASLSSSALTFSRHVGLSLGTGSTVQIAVSTCATATT